MSGPLELGTVGAMHDATEPINVLSSGRPEDADDEQTWLTPLAASGPLHDAAVRRLHELLVRAASHEVRRRAAQLGLGQSSDLDDLSMQAADDALIAILARLDRFERRSAFTTWAYKFAIHTAGVAVRKRAWRGREIASSDAAFAQLESHYPEPSAASEQRDLIRRITSAIGHLTPRQRDVLLALCVTGVPIDVLAERLGSTRGAVYKTLHDARQAIRKRLDDESHTPLTNHTPLKTLEIDTNGGAYRG
ncbi:MAG: sigma-70 family polymerase sigma factor [Thermoleophilia bacterium]|nr:sigma-70 family polymerase sigma factor [Thermoleophilia bacterium]